MLKQIPESDKKRWLNGQEQIWRYVPLHTLFLYLNGMFFIPSIAKLRKDDPFEGEFYEGISWFNDAFDKRYADEATKLENWILETWSSESERHYAKLNRGNARATILRAHYFGFVHKTRFASCWFCSNRESAAMWNNYGKHGVAIQTTVQKLGAALGTNGHSFDYGRMRYVDHEDYRAGVCCEFNPEHESDFQLLLRPYFLKRSEYKSEDEVRFVTVGPENRARGGIMLRNIVPSTWISAIRLCPKITADEEDSLKRTVKKILPRVACTKSDLLTDPSRSKAEDFFRCDLEKSELSKWQDGKDGIPIELKEL